MKSLTWQASPSTPAALGSPATVPDDAYHVDDDLTVTFDLPSADGGSKSPKRVTRRHLRRFLAHEVETKITRAPLEENNLDGVQMRVERHGDDLVIAYEDPPAGAAESAAATGTSIERAA